MTVSSKQAQTMGASPMRRTSTARCAVSARALRAHAAVVMLMPIKTPPTTPPMAKARPDGGGEARKGHEHKVSASACVLVTWH
jgi:hypothetical protein